MPPPVKRHVKRLSLWSKADLTTFRSYLTPKADVRRNGWNVRFVPMTDIRQTT